MFFKISQEFANNLKRLLAGVFTDEEFYKGMEAFENLINIKDDKSDFNQEYGMFLNEKSFLSPEWDVSFACRLEGFFRKIEILKRRNTVNENQVQGEEVFHLTEVYMKNYGVCSGGSDSYMSAYQLNSDVSEGSTDYDPVKRIEKIKNLFIVYMDQCILNYNLIDEGYEKELLTERIDYVKFASERIEMIDSFNRGFLQLSWFDENDRQFVYDFNSCVKFVGEAGMGKTTQMRKMYFEILELVKNGQKNVLPLWIDLSEMSELQDISLEEKIRSLLGEYEQYYDLLLRRNILILFLDGYNEVLSKDMQDVIKRKLAGDIDDIHTKYPQILIALTDRGKKSIPPCLMKNVHTYTFNGLSRDEMREYILLKTETALANKILNYLDDAASKWIGNTKIIPAKMNSLIDLMKDDIVPVDEDDFYDKYLDFILDREAYEKKETRIDDLKYLLYILAGKLNHAMDEMSQNEIIRLWLSEGQVGELAEARRLFKLATEFPILVPGSNDKVFRFAYTQYFQKMHEGL